LIRSVEWSDFVHTTNDLVTVMVGKLRMIIREEKMIAKPGDEVFIPKGFVIQSRLCPLARRIGYIGMTEEGRTVR